MPSKTEEQQPQNVSKAIEAIVGTAREAKGIAGVSVGVDHAGDTIALGFGFSNIERRLHATARTAYCVGSITKQFTATAIMQLQARGLLDLDDELAKYVPACNHYHPSPHLRHLLNHTSGIPSALDQAMLVKPANQDQGLPASLATDLACQQPGALPGTEWHYSNAGYCFLGLVIERITEESYWSYLRKNVLGPSGMSATWFGSNDVPWDVRAHGYEVRKSGLVGVDFPSVQQTFSSGALFSTVQDLLAWQRSLNGGLLLDEESIGQMTTPEHHEGWEQNYGYGVFVSDLAGHREISHDGNTGGYSCQLAHYPDDALTVAVLSNSRRHEAENIEKAITRYVLGIPEPSVGKGRMQSVHAANYAGTYRYGSTDVPVYEERGRLWVRSPSGSAVQLLWQGGHTFASATDDSLSFRFDMAAERPHRFVVSRGSKTLAIASRVV